MIIHLSDCIAVTVKPSVTFTVGFNEYDPLFWGVGFEPVEKRWTKVKAEIDIIVVDVGNHSFLDQADGKPWTVDRSTRVHLNRDRARPTPVVK